MSNNANNHNCNIAMYVWWYVPSAPIWHIGPTILWKCFHNIYYFRNTSSKQGLCRNSKFLSDNSSTIKRKLIMWIVSILSQAIYCIIFPFKWINISAYNLSSIPVQQVEKELEIPFPEQSHKQHLHNLWLFVFNKFTELQ